MVVSAVMMVVPIARQRASASVVCRSSRCGSRWVAPMMGRVSPTMLATLTMTLTFRRRRPLVSVDGPVMLVMLVSPLCMMMLVTGWLPHLLLLVVMVRRRSLTVMALLWLVTLMSPWWVLMVMITLMMMRSLLRVMLVSAALA